MITRFTTPPANATDISHQALGDPGSILFLGGCALALLAGCVLRLERFVAYWDSFEYFVRAVVG